MNCFDAVSAGEDLRSYKIRAWVDRAIDRRSPGPRALDDSMQVHNQTLK